MESLTLNLDITAKPLPYCHAELIKREDRLELKPIVAEIEPHVIAVEGIYDISINVTFSVTYQSHHYATSMVFILTLNGCVSILQTAYQAPPHHRSHVGNILATGTNQTQVSDKIYWRGSSIYRLNRGDKLDFRIVKSQLEIDWSVDPNSQFNMVLLRATNTKL